MIRVHPGGTVAALTTAAFVGIAVLGAQALHGTPGGGPLTSPEGAATEQQRPGPRGRGQLPPGSGQGRRVVYALGEHRVWLVGSDGRPRRSFTVRPGTVQPDPGDYRVRSRTGRTVGSDGAPVEHVVRFASRDGLAIGFSAAVESRAEGARQHAEHTGGIRLTRDDSTAVWRFAMIDDRVVVVG